MGKLVKFFSYVVSPLIVCVFVYIYLSSPVYNGYVTHNHSKYGVVYIRRDSNSIPTIKGTTLRDSLFGLGYAHCQDRLWSMDLQRRLATGRISELFGNKTLDLDISQREYGLLDIVKQMKLDDSTRENLQAYTDGVNECHYNNRARSLEYIITRSEFDEWKNEDTMSILMMIQLHLTQDFPAEIVREKLGKIYGKQMLERMTIHWERGTIPLETIMTEEDVEKMSLYEYYNKTAFQRNQIDYPEISKQSLDQLLETGITQFLDHQRGSNTWAIHGNHTTTGKPIVANDPHLSNGIPSFWYQAHLIYQNNRNITVSGSTVPGVPGIFSGMSDYIAWGVTALSSDIADLYAEKINENETQYFFEGEWRDLKIRNEEIKIKGEQTYKLKVKETHHGPILNSKDENSNLSLCWVNRIQTMKTLSSLFKLYEATNIDQVINSFQNFEANFGISFGTNDNHIGFFASGILPLRNNPSSGSFIQDGTQQKNDWKGFLPSNQNPHIVDPSRGFVVAANNKISPNNAKGFTSVSMPPTSRATRIREMIEEFIKAGKKISVEDVKKMQQDTVDVYAREVTKPMLHIYDKNKHEILQTNKTQTWDALMEHLHTWNYSFDLESVGATIFSTLNYQICKKFIYRYDADEKKKNEAIFYYHMDTFVLNTIVNWSFDKDIDATFCDHTSSFSHKTKCLKLFFSAVQDTYTYLKKKLGDNMALWQWKNVHKKIIPHKTFTSIQYLKDIFDRSYPAAGNKRTVGVNAENYKENDFNSVFSANMRSVYSLEKSDKSYFVVDTGISESILSSHYSDQLDLYSKGLYIEVKRDLNKLKENNVDMLLLVYDPKRDLKSEFTNETKTKKEDNQEDIKTDI